MYDVLDKIKRRVLAKKSSIVNEEPAIYGDKREAEVNKWLLSEFIQKNILPLVGCSPYPLDELLVMIGAVCWVKPTKIFEWGTHVGKSARIFHESCRRFSINAEIHSIDLPDSEDHVEHPRSSRGKMVKGIRGVSLHQGDGVTTALSLVTPEDRRGGRLLYFLDGDHAYESVKRELGLILQDGCWEGILVHDTFYQTDVSGYNIGPYQAVRDMLGERKDVAIYSTVLGLPGMTFVLREK